MVEISWSEAASHHSSARARSRNSGFFGDFCMKIFSGQILCKTNISYFQIYFSRLVDDSPENQAAVDLAARVERLFGK